MHRLPRDSGALAIAVLQPSLNLRSLCMVPVSKLRLLLKIGHGKEKQFRWDELYEWQVDPAILPGYDQVKEFMEPGSA